MTKTLLVGGGLTSAVTAYLLTKPGQLRNLELCVWDKARGCGGRMSTSRLTSTPNSNCSADLGAQYITATEDYAKLHSDYYDDLLANKLLDPLKLPIEGHKTPVDGSINYVCPQGSSSLVKHFFKKAAAQVKFGKKVSKIENNSKQWTVSAEDGDTDGEAKYAGGAEVHGVGHPLSQSSSFRGGAKSITEFLFKNCRFKTNVRIEQSCIVDRNLIKTSFRKSKVF